MRLCSTFHDDNDGWDDGWGQKGGQKGFSAGNGTMIQVVSEEKGTSEVLSEATSQVKSLKEVAGVAVVEADMQCPNRQVPKPQLATE